MHPSTILAVLATAAISLVHATPLAGSIPNELTARQATPGGVCGRTTCAADMYCCNPTCSMCVPPDGMCTMQDCGHTRPEPAPKPTPTPPRGVQCNKNVCGAGEFCCNHSCGICAPKGGACIQIFCPPEVKE